MFYAETDWSTGDNPSEYTSGFSNTAEVIAFTTRKARDEWVQETKLLSAKPLTRTQAIRMTSWVCGDYLGFRLHDKVKAVRVYGTDDKYHLLAGKNY